MDQKILDLYDEYTHAPLPRRVFLARLANLAGGAAAAAVLLPLLEGTGAEAAMIAGDDPRLTAGYIQYAGATGTVRAYRAHPAGAVSLPAAVVIHENRGLNAHIEDVARRVAVAGYLAIAPDMLSPAGGTPADQDVARDMIRKLDGDRTVANLVAAVAYLRDHPLSTGKVGCVGFCWGGLRANLLAVNSVDLSAAVVYYGSQPEASDVPRITAPLLLHYAGLDKRINAGIADFEAALKKAGKSYTKHIYEGANHAFNNDTREARYHPEAATLAWQRTLDFFEKNLM